MTEEELAQEIQHSRKEIARLNRRIDELQARTALISPSFMRRAFAVFGHYFVAGLIIAVPFYAIVLFVILIGAALQAF
jgi:hypothetical protein